VKRTDHLNLRWTVGDMDRVNFMSKNRQYTVEEISKKLAGTQLEASPFKLRELASAFGVDVRLSAYEVSLS
jgi:hypothetical protein